MNLDELQQQAEKDLKIDDTELDIESLNTLLVPFISKYIALYTNYDINIF